MNHKATGIRAGVGHLRPGGETPVVLWMVGCGIKGPATGWMVVIVAAMQELK